MAISSSGKQIAVTRGYSSPIDGVVSNAVQVLEVGKDQPSHSLTGLFGKADWPAFSSDERTLIWVSSYGEPSGTMRSKIWMLNLTESEPICLVDVDGPRFLAVTLSPDGRWLAAGRIDGTVSLAADGKILVSFMDGSCDSYDAQSGVQIK